MLEKVKEYAINCHRIVNHLYDNKSYKVHLQMVEDTAMKFLHLIPEIERVNVLSACWAHDVIEDCRQTYSDVKSISNIKVAELVFALTNEKGKTRKERANDKYYNDIKNLEFATFIKVCDRIANYEYSIKSKSSKVDMYKKEMPSFIEKLYDDKYKELFDYLKSLNGN